MYCEWGIRVVQKIKNIGIPLGEHPHDEILPPCYSFGYSNFWIDVCVYGRLRPSHTVEKTLGVPPLFCL